VIRKANATDFDDIRAVINDGASAYKGFIPDDRWHEPYMSKKLLQTEMDAGVEFFCAIDGGQVAGVMGIQDMGPVVLIRHAYVRTLARRRGLGGELLASLTREVSKPILIGTWKAAAWAIKFYEKNGFKLLPDAAGKLLLETYWDIPARQMETSVVLADSRFIRTHQ
jgi:GNAT superfamily N-acetyltransferase